MAPNPDDGRALWRRAVQDVKPLRPRPEPPPAKPALERPTPPNPAPPAGRTAAPPSHRDPGAGYDRANAERLKRGKHPIEARLDLHGMTQAQAHRALAAFVHDARADGKRCVLVITGRGSGQEFRGGGVLKAAVPRWLGEPEFRPHVLAVATAQPRDGGSGALYIMLRRTRSG
jgi:DNA-nicking Smr family endonuclease